MGEIIEFPSNGSNGRGYLAEAAGGGPAVIVIQEWWGLVPHICEVVDRFASAGFTALAPDLYRGETTTEPDEAGKLMMALNLDRAARDMSGAIEALLARPATTSSKVGVVGFCMGGGLALKLACDRADVVGACAPFYGLIPWEGALPDWSKLQAPVRGHYAELDGFFGPAAVAELQATLDGLGKDAQLTVHPGVQHAFFNDHRPEVYAAAEAEVAWETTISFLSSALG
ncbi:MAG: dienelactone hydrolase family protein [Microthrixaceae bacterium]|jgi:carboxymethylenebutenolidase